MRRLLLLLVPLCALSSLGQLRVGVATVDITPEYPIRLSGYGGRRTPSEGIAQRLHAQALAIHGPSGQPALILAVDNVGVPGWLTEKLHQRIAAETKLPRAQFAVCSTHTHTGPMMAGVLSNLFGVDIPPDHWEAIERYTRETEEKLFAISMKALRETQAAELHFGIGRARFAKNRRTERGPVDHDVPVLAAKNAKGEWMAVLSNYACHCTTLGGEFNQHCGDWAAYAREYLEKDFPAAKAMVAIGCGADSNPHPRTGLELAQKHGRELADEIARLLKSDLKKISGAPMGAFARFPLAFDTLPTRAEWEEKAKQGGAIAYHAKKNLERLDRGEKLPTELEYSLQVLSFGKDLAMVFMPGEVVVDYSLRIKRMYDPLRVWVNAYANDVPCYIPSRRIWKEGGYEGGGAMVYYDRPTRLAADTEDRIFTQLEKLIPADFKAAPENQPKPPEEALKTIRVPAGFEVELVVSEPLVVDPVAIDFAADGRLWVVEMHDYPSGLDGNYKPGGRVKVLSATNGKFDRAQMLADDLPFPTGVMAWRKGALVCAAPDIIYIEDTDGDGKTDVRKKLYSGFSTENYQARVNGLRWGLDGWIYGAAGLFGGKITSHLTGKTHALSGRDFRIKPDTGEFEQVAGLSQQGRVRDDFGNWFGCDNGTWAWHFPIPDHYLGRNPAVAFPDLKVRIASEPNSNEVYPISATLERFNDPDNANRATSACGIEIYRDTALGAEFYGNIFTPEPVHNLVHRLVVQPHGSTFKGVRAATEQNSEFIASTDNWFRPVEVRTGPDGALWIVDMYRYVIEHPRWISAERLAKLDVRAGSDKGRIYRVVKTGHSRHNRTWNLERAEDFFLSETVAATDENNGVLRDLAHRLLLEREKESGPSPFSTPAGIVQTLHLRSQKGSLSDADLSGALTNAHSGVRIAALRLSEGRESMTAHIAKLGDDSDPHVRLQAALTFGEFSNPEIGAALVKIALRAKDDPRIRAAVLSSAPKHAEALFKEARRADAKPLLDGLKRTLAASTNAPSAPLAIIPAPAREKTDRSAVLKEYASVADLKGNANRGLILFADNCASCHSFRGLGHNLGPDVATYRGKPAADYIKAILDPNDVIEPRFATHEIETKEGHTFTGILTGENATSFTLAQPNSLSETLLRIELASIKATGVSLMPEGLEAALSPENMADLIAYLKTPDPVQFAAGIATEPKTLTATIQKLSASETLDYPSWAGRSPFHHCRQSDGNGRVEWESASSTDWHELPAAMGFISQPKGTFTLQVNGAKAFNFNVTLQDVAFGDATAPIRAAYRVIDRNQEDASGILAIHVPNSAGKPTRFTVTGSGANSQRWFGVYELNAPQLSAAQKILQLAAKDANRKVPAIWQIAIDAAKRDNDAELREILEATLPLPYAPLEEWQAVVLGGGMINGIAQLGHFPKLRIDQLAGPLAARWERALKLSIAMCHDDKVIPGTRYDALRMAALLDWPTARKALEPYLAKEAHPELQQGAVSGLLDVDHPEARALLESSLPNLTPSNRKLAEGSAPKRVSR